MESKDEDSLGSSLSDQYFELTINPKFKGVRLDQFLVHHIPSVSRSQVGISIRNGLIFVDNICKKSSYRLKHGETVTGTFAEPLPIKIVPEKIDFPVLFEDEYLLLLSKPPGLVVHPGSGNHSGTLVNGLVYYCQSISEVGDDLRPGLVHRLDKDTSGIMLVAKKDFVHRQLVDIFKNRLLTKEYLAIVHGVLAEKKGRLVASIGRHPVNRQKMCIRDDTGRHAVTNWEVLQEFDANLSLVKVTIETGRTHQIRVHMDHLGCPVAGDSVYGSNRNPGSFPRQLLHASRLVFDHPVTGEKIDIKAPLWPDFEEILENISLSHASLEER